MVSCSCSTSGTLRVNLVTNPVIRHESRHPTATEAQYLILNDISSKIIKQESIHGIEKKRL